MLTQKLKEFGLTDKEVNIYISLLKLGESTAQEIANEANTNRPYCYEILKSLKTKGLVIQLIKSGTRYFNVVDPQKIEKLLEEKTQSILSIIPELKKLYNSIGNVPQVEVYEGLQGIKTIIDDIIKEGKELKIYASTTKLTKFLNHNFPQYIKKRVEANIHAKVVTEKNKLTLDMKKRDKEELRDMRFFPTKMDFATWTTIYNNKVAIISLEGNFFGLIIENELITKTQDFIFELLWNQALKE